MIRQFGLETCLLLIDVQVGVDDVVHWGGEKEEEIILMPSDLCCRCCQTGERQVCLLLLLFMTVWKKDSPLKLDLPGGSLKEGFSVEEDDICVVKHVNSGFVGTSLDEDLKLKEITRLVVVGFFTNMCVETTVRMAGNMGYDTYLVPEGAQQLIA